MKNILGLAIVILIAFTTSCKKNEDPLQLPPEGSFIMDFSDFKDTSTTKSTKGDTTYQNVAFSVVNVGVWNFLITVGMAVPVAAFVESFKHEPSQDKEGWWNWTYSFNVGVATYTANLKGKRNDSKINWEMYISKTGFGAFTDFLWYTGESNVDNTSGKWILYEKPTNASQMLQITWSDDKNGTADIKYENIIPNGAENGGYINYGKNTNEPFNRFYDIFNKGKNNHTNIEWNKESKEGRVMDPIHFSDNSWHCWTSEGVDIVCE